MSQNSMFCTVIDARVPRRHAHVALLQGRDVKNAGGGDEWRLGFRTRLDRPTVKYLLCIIEVPCVARCQLYLEDGTMDARDEWPMVGNSGGGQGRDGQLQELGKTSSWHRLQTT